MDNETLRVQLSFLRAGDRTAFEDIYEALKTPVYTIIVRCVGDRGLAEDVLQEVFLKLYRAPPSASVSKPRAYLFQMARNCALDALHARRTEASFEAVGATAPDFTLRVEIETAMERLPLLERQIVTLHLNGGLKFREIAEMIGKPLGTVLWRYQTALSQLRSTLSGGT